MHLRAFTGTTLFPTFAVTLGIFAAVGLAIFLSSHAFAQSNSAPDFGATTATRTVNEYTGTEHSRNDEPWYEDIGAPVTATDADQDKLTYSNQERPFVPLLSLTGSPANCRSADPSTTRRPVPTP